MPDAKQEVVKLLSDDEVAEIEARTETGHFPDLDTIATLCATVRALRIQLEDTAQLAAKAGATVTKYSDENTALREQLAEVERERNTLQLLLTSTEKFNTQLQQSVKGSHEHAAEVASRVFALAKSFRDRLIRETHKQAFKTTQAGAINAIESVGTSEWPGSYYKPRFIKAVKSLTETEPEL